MTHIPIINIEQLDKPAGINTVADQITHAGTQCGFFYIEGHGISDSLISRIRSVQREFFALPLPEKKKVAISKLNRGYLGQGEARMHGARNYDQKEVFFWGAELKSTHPDVLANIPLCGPNQWPVQPAEFKKTVLEYANKIHRVGNLLLKAIAVSLGASPDFFEQYFSDPLLRGQLIRYPQTVGTDENFGVAPHSDFGCITLLLQETPGLEVCIDNRWIAAPPIDGTLVVNIGDLLERWSNQQLHSTRHRVKNITTDASYSIAMFHDPSPTALVDPCDLNPEIDKGKYAPVKAADYILERNKGAFSHYAKVDEQQTDSLHR